MKGLIGASLVASLVMLMVPDQADARYCGAARYRCCAPSCQPCYHTVMKTVKCTVWDKECVTCHKTVYDRVCEDKVINCTRYVPQTRTKEVCYTVASLAGKIAAVLIRSASPAGKPRQKEVCYTVCKALLGNSHPRVHRLQALLGNSHP